MQPVLLADLAAGAARASTPPAVPLGDVSVSGVTLDSRSVRPGDLYAALAGFNVHGAAFAAAAVASGATAVLTDAAGEAGSVWERMFFYYQFRREEFLRHYHARSNVEID